jgi:molybdate transport system regulatory protein
MSKLRVTLRVDFDRNNAIGPGKIALLEKMREHGSLSQAARALDMSYRRAWQLLNSLNQSFREPLVVTAIGGSGGGGSTLTALGESMIATYRDFEEAMNARADKQFGPFLKNVSGGSSSTRRPVSKSQQATAKPARKTNRH